MKYIMFKKKMQGGELTHFVPVIFPSNLVHAMVAESMTVDTGPLRGYTPDSAGEYSPMSGECTGSSETLKLEANEDRDTRFILMNDYGGCFE